MGTHSEQLTGQRCHRQEGREEWTPEGSFWGNSDFWLAHSKFQKPYETSEEVRSPWNKTGAQR